MDILKMLQNDTDDLCKEDIEMIQEELVIGHYSASYKNECRRLLVKLKREMEDDELQQAYTGKKIDTSSLIQNEEKTVVLKQEPVVETPAAEPVKTRLEIFREEIKKMRSMSDPIKRFSEYIDKNEFVTNDFIDQNLGEFNELERNELSVIIKRKAG